MSAAAGPFVIHEVPELAIIDADLWQAVKDRQKSLDAKRTKNGGMWELENHKEELTQLIANTAEASVYIHPNMGTLYREKVSELAKGLSIDLHGALAGILSLSQKSKNASVVSDEDLCKVKLVAGARCQRQYPGVFQAMA